MIVYGTLVLYYIKRNLFKQCNIIYVHIQDMIIILHIPKNMKSILKYKVSYSSKLVKQLLYRLRRKILL